MGHRLTAGVGIGVVVGFLYGLLLPGWVAPVDFLGDLFLALLKMIVVPLVAVSVFLGVASLESLGRLKTLGAKTLLYYLATTSLAVLLGLILVNLVRPGVGVALATGGPQSVPPAEGLTLRDFVLRLIPTNPFGSLAQGDILPVIVFSLLLGAAVIPVRNREPLLRVSQGLNDAILALTGWIMWLAPVGVMGLVAAVVAEKGLGVLAPIARYAATVVLGLLIHAGITLPVILALLGRQSALGLFHRVKGALAVAFSTASSSATLPVTLEAIETEAGVRPEVAGFVLPLGATINMDGTALYEAVAALFIAQAYGITLSLPQQAVVFLTATLAAIGAAGIPSAGLVTMALVLRAVGLPLEGIGLILAVDRFLDMLRTTVNVWGDCIGAALVDRWERSPAG